jgi:hypothetical protein
MAEEETKKRQFQQQLQSEEDGVEFKVGELNLEDEF